MPTQERIKLYASLSRDFFRNPSLEKYLTIRQTLSLDTSARQLSSRHYRHRHQHLRSELSKHGVNPKVFDAAMKGDERQMDALGVQLIEAVIRQQKMKADGPTAPVVAGRAVADSLVNYVIMLMLEVCQERETDLPTSLIFLVRQQLRCWKPEILDLEEREQLRSRAILIAALMLSRGEKVSLRKIAKEMQVEPTTVLRWFAKGELQEEAEFIRDLAPLIRHSSWVPRKPKGK